MIIHGHGPLPRMDRCDKDAIIWQVIGMYRCVGKACTHAGRSSTRAGRPFAWLRLAEMHGLMGRRACRVRREVVVMMIIARRPAGESPRHIAVHAQSAAGEEEGSVSLATHMVLQECATSCLYNDAVFQDLLCHLYTHAFCAFFLFPSMADDVACSLFSPTNPSMVQINLIAQSMNKSI